MRNIQYYNQESARLANKLVGDWNKFWPEETKFTVWQKFIVEWINAMNVQEVPTVPIGWLFFSLADVGQIISAEIPRPSGDGGISSRESRNAIAEQTDKMAVKTGVTGGYTLPRECNNCGTMFSLNDPTPNFPVNLSPLRYNCGTCH